MTQTHEQLVKEERLKFAKTIRVNIPSSLFFSDSLSYREIKLYIIIAELTYMHNEACTASNETLAKLLGIREPDQIRKMISKLKKERYLIVKLIDNNKRTITLPEISLVNDYRAELDPNRLELDLKEFITYMRTNIAMKCTIGVHHFSNKYTQDFTVAINEKGYLCNADGMHVLPKDTSNKLWQEMWKSQNKLFKLFENLNKRAS